MNLLHYLLCCFALPEEVDWHLYYLLCCFALPEEVDWHLWFRCKSKDANGVQCVQHFYAPVSDGGVPSAGKTIPTRICPTCGGDVTAGTFSQWVGRREWNGWKWLRPADPERVERVGEQTIWSSPFSGSNPDAPS